MKTFMQHSEDKLEQLQFEKCIEDDCYNYREYGHIRCVTHLHGIPCRMSDEDIAILQEAEANAEEVRYETIRQRYNKQEA